MKKALVILAVIAFATVSTGSFAQCDTESQSSACIPKLSSGFNFLKTYSVDGLGGTKQKVEYSYVFTKGTQYMLNLCTPAGDSDGVTVSLFDSKRNMVGSNEHKGENLSAFVYQCKVTGIYYITYTFNESKNNCAGSALGFKK